MVPLGSIVITILLGAFNFHGKKKEIFKAVGIIFCIVISILFVWGMYVGMLVLNFFLGAL